MAYGRGDVLRQRPGKVEGAAGRDVAAVAVVGVLAQAHVGDDGQAGHSVFDRPRRALHRLGVVRRG